MSLFGFGDIKFNNDKRDGFGPLAALEGTEYQRETFRYPTDVGAFDKGHYMVFYVREQNRDAIAAGFSGSKDIPLPKFEPGSETYQNIRTGSELSSKISSGANQIKSAVGNMGGSFTSKISSLGGSMDGFAGGSISGAINSIGNKIKGGASSIFGQTNVLKGNTQSTSKILDYNFQKITSSKLINTTTRTKEAIAIYMPDTLMYNHTQSYSSVQLGGGIAGAILAAGRSAVESFKKNGGKLDGGTLLKSATAGLKELASASAAGAVESLVGGAAGNADMGKAASIAILGQIQNPMLEMIYSSPNFRKFQFDFLFYPRDETEALEVQNILDRFKYHQAPEFGTGINQESGATLRPPSEFDIKFYYGAGENPNIPEIAQGCVLETIDVNYAPNGASFYEVPGENIPALGRTGMPTAVQLTLNFTETRILTKNDLRNPAKEGGSR